LRSLREAWAGGEGAFATWVDAAGLAWHGVVAEAGSKLRSLLEAVVGGEGASVVFVGATGSAWRGAVAEAGVVVVGAVGVVLDGAWGCPSGDEKVTFLLEFDAFEWRSKERLVILDVSGLEVFVVSEERVVIPSAAASGASSPSKEMSGCHREAEGTRRLGVI